MGRSRKITGSATSPTPKRAARRPQQDASVQEGRRVLEIEARAVQELMARLDDRFASAVNFLYECQGKVVISGMGKSGLIGQKIAATLASTGTPSFFLHPAEGVHGDLGMLARRDVLIAISNSGETQEVLQLLPFVKRMNIPVVGMTGKMASTLAKNSDVTLDVSVDEEARLVLDGHVGQPILLFLRHLQNQRQQGPEHHDGYRACHHDLHDGVA